MAGHELPPAHGEPHVFWTRHPHRLVDCMLALAIELDLTGRVHAADRIRSVLNLDYNPLFDDKLPDLGDPPTAMPRLRPPAPNSHNSSNIRPEPGS